MKIILAIIVPGPSCVLHRKNAITSCKTRHYGSHEKILCENEKIFYRKIYLRNTIKILTLITADNILFFYSSCNPCLNKSRRRCASTHTFIRPVYPPQLMTQAQSGNEFLIRWPLGPLQISQQTPTLVNHAQ